MPIDPFITGGATLIGNLISGLFGSSAQDSANQTNINLALGNREWMTGMSNTSHQREVQDLKAAGLNPIMSANGGASTPATSAAQVGASNPMEGVGPGIAAAMDVAKLDLAQKATDAEVKNKDSDTALNKAAVITEAARAQSTVNSARESELRGNLLHSTMGNQIKKSKLEGDQADYDLKNIELDNAMKRIQQGVGIGSTALDMFNPIGKAAKWLREGKELKNKKQLLEELKRVYRNAPPTGE